MTGATVFYIVDVYLLPTVQQEIADPNVPEVGKCHELAVLLLGTLPLTLLSGGTVT